MELILFVNDLIQDAEQEKVYRVLWVSNPPAIGYWISICDTTRIPQKMEFATIAEGLETGKYIRVKEIGLPIINENLLSAEAKGHRDKIWNMLKEVMAKEPDIYEAKTRAELLRGIERETGYKVSNLYPYLARYWKRGKIPNAFLPDYHNCGRNRDYQKGDYKKPGRPVRNGRGFGKKLQEQDFRNFEKAIHKYYLTRQEPTFKSTYERLLADHYSVKASNPDGKEVLQLLPADELPSIAQFRYWYQKNQDLKEEIQKRKGNAKYELTSRKVLGKSDHGLMGPGAKFQIDATVGDIYLVSQFDRGNIIGRPVMYFVVDVFSRIVTGMYIGLEGPSWIGAMMAIANAATDKVAYCRDFGIGISEAEWPCHHIPAAILGDRGEMESKNADNLVSMLGIRIENAPPYRADLKGIIEQHFRTININSTVFLPGKVKPNMAERGGRDYRLDAKLDIRQFTAIIIKCVLYYNNSHHMESFEKSSQMMEAGVEAIPVKLWNWGIRFCSGALRTCPEEKVRLALMPTGKASVTSKGIRFKGLYYSSEEAEDGLWFEKARSRGSYRVSVSYDPRDMGQIFVWDDSDGSHIPCSLLNWEGKFAGKQLEEVQYEQEKEKLEKKQHQAQETEARINLNYEIETIVKDAEQLSAAKDSRSKSERLAGIRQNRKEEKEQIRRQEAFTVQGEPEPAVDTSVEEPEEMSPVLRMIKQKMEEKIKDESLYGKGTISGTDHSGIPGESSD